MIINYSFITARVLEIYFSFKLTFIDRKLVYLAVDSKLYHVVAVAQFTN